MANPYEDKAQSSAWGQWSGVESWRLPTGSPAWNARLQVEAQKASEAKKAIVRPLRTIEQSPKPLSVDSSRSRSLDYQFQRTPAASSLFSPDACSARSASPSETTLGRQITGIFRQEWWQYESPLSTLASAGEDMAELRDLKNGGAILGGAAVLILALVLPGSTMKITDISLWALSAGGALAGWVLVFIIGRAISLGCVVASYLAVWICRISAAAGAVAGVGFLALSLLKSSEAKTPAPSPMASLQQSPVQRKAVRKRAPARHHAPVQKLSDMQFIGIN